MIKAAKIETKYVFRFSCKVESGLSLNNFLFKTIKAAKGKIRNNNFSITPSGARRESFAPMEEPTIAVKTEGMANLRLTRPFFMKRKVAKVVPQVDDNLLVAIA